MVRWYLDSGFHRNDVEFDHIPWSVSLVSIRGQSGIASEGKYKRNEATGSTLDSYFGAVLTSL